MLRVTAAPDPAAPAARSPAARRARIAALVVLSIVCAPIAVVVLYAYLKTEGRR